MPATLEEPKTKIVALRAPIAYSSPGEVEVDAEKGIIKNVALMTIGPARGWGFDIDATTLTQLSELINSEPSGMGVKCRVTHPDISDDGQMSDDLMQLVGRVRNARIVGNAARGDVHLGSFAKSVPGLGDVWTYLCALTKDDPTALGMSAMFSFKVDPKLDDQGNPVSLPARINSVVGVDFVGKPAANPNGLLSEPANLPPSSTVPAAATPTKSKGESKMDPQIKTLLVGMGMKCDASDEEATEYMNGLSAEQKATLQQKSVAATADKTKAAVAVMAEPRKVANDVGDQIVGLETKRKDTIVALASALKVGETGIDDDVVLKCVSDGLTPEQSRGLMLANLALKTTALKQPAGGHLRVGKDNATASLGAHMGDAVALRMIGKMYDRHTDKDRYDRAVAQIKTKDNDRTQGLASLQIKPMYRKYLGALGYEDAMSIPDRKLEDLLSLRELRRTNSRVAALAESTGDFSNITLDALNKTLRIAYLDAPKTWPQWARRTTNPDFKNINRVALSESPNMKSRNEGGEIKYVTMTDSKETYVLGEYALLLRLTRRVIINDDLDAFSRIPLLQTNAAIRLEEDTAYGILTGNAAMADTGAIFNATAVSTAGGHANLTSSGGVPGVTQLQTGFTSMMVQKGLTGDAFLELTPKFLLVPTAIYFTARQAVDSDRLLAVVSSTTAAPNTIGESNPFFKTLTVIPSARLNANNTTAWYLLADYRDMRIDTCEMCFLEDEPDPVAKQETDFDSDDVKFALRHTVAGKCIAFQGMYKNAGV